MYSKRQLVFTRVPDGRNGFRGMLMPYFDPQVHPVQYAETKLFKIMHSKGTGSAEVNINDKRIRNKAKGQGRR